MAENQSYNAENITSLDPRTHVRHRVGMYLGGASDAALTKALTEVIDNSRDEALAGHGNTIDVTFYADGSAEVEDAGRGLPVDRNKEGVSGFVLTVGRTGSGAKFDSKAYESAGGTGGTNGVGSAATNFTSVRFDVTVYRGGKKHQLSFREGLPGHFAKPNDPDAKFTEGDEIKISSDDRSAAVKKQRPTGTKIRFWPDFSVFVKDSKFLFDDVKFQLKSTAFLMPNIYITLNDKRDPANEQSETFHFETGISDMLATLTHHPLVTKPVRIETEGSFTQETNAMVDGGKMERREVERKIKIDVAFAYTNVEETIVKSFVNLIPTPNGGTHESGMWRALSRVFVNYIKDNARAVGLKAKEEPPTLEDVRDGFVGALAIKLPEPTYTGQEKSTLATPQATAVISQALGAELQKWIADKKNATELKRIATKIVEASRIRLAAKTQKDTARKKSALETSASMPAKLTPCISKNPDEISLLICEGKSALGGLKQARDARLAAIYPLRGKPSNTYDMALGAILKNQEWSDLIQILGAGIGKDCDPSKLRYKTIIVVADADDDGVHIFSLVSAGFWRLMRPVIEQGHFYVALPPLFSITTTGRNPQRYYALDEPERDLLIAKLAKEGKKYDKITRHKGLGEYAPEILGDTVLNPTTRRLKRVTVADVEAFERTLELTMGKDADARKEWILENRALISEDEIDA